MSGGTVTRAPWPGPRPYEESEWELFYGRSKEVDEVERRIASERLVVVTGRSGTGKTSLLRAGIVPRLRLRRFRGKKATPWPVLVLRNWGGGKRTSLSDLLQAEVKRAVDALTLWSEEGVRATEDRVLLSESLSEAGKDCSPVDLIENLAASNSEKIAGLIIVLDQLEEVLRLGTGVTEEMTEFLRDLYDSALPLRLVLSLREEYLSELRGLERTVGGLLGRTVFLSPMLRQTAQEAIGEAGRAGGIEIEDEAVDEIFDWIGLREGLLRGRKRALVPDPSWEESADETPDLLTLQAILFEVFQEFLALKAKDRSAKLDTAFLKTYRQKYGPDGPEIVGNALVRWIERAFEIAVHARGRESQGEMGSGPLTALMRRVAVRIAPHLSSAGYKIAQERSDLFRKAVGEDVWALGLRDPELRARVRIVGGERPRLNFEELGLASEPMEAAEQYLSGVALEQGWDLVQASEQLLSAFLASLERLAEQNIVKPVYSWESRNEESWRWELVHDGLGRPFADWAEKRRNSWEDCAASIVACRGVSPIALRSEDPPRDALRFARWEGCHVAPVTESMIVLEGVEFLDCALRGTIFEHIVLRNCTFTRCDLSGTVFRHCVFEATNGRQVSFKDCYPPSMAILKSRLGGLSFDGCVLSQLTMKECRLEGSVTLRRTDVELANFILLEASKPSHELVFEGTCRVAYSSGDEQSWKLMRLQCPVVHSGWQRE